MNLRELLNCTDWVVGSALWLLLDGKAPPLNHYVITPSGGGGVSGVAAIASVYALACDQARYNDTRGTSEGIYEMAKDQASVVDNAQVCGFMHRAALWGLHHRVAERMLEGLRGQVERSALLISADELDDVLRPGIGFMARAYLSGRFVPTILPPPADLPHAIVVDINDPRLVPPATLPTFSPDYLKRPRA